MVLTSRKKKVYFSIRHHLTWNLLLQKNPRKSSSPMSCDNLRWICCLSQICCRKKMSWLARCRRIKLYLSSGFLRWCQIYYLIPIFGCLNCKVGGYGSFLEWNYPSKSQVNNFNTKAYVHLGIPYFQEPPIWACQNRVLTYINPIKTTLVLSGFCKTWFG